MKRNINKFYIVRTVILYCLFIVLHLTRDNGIFSKDRRFYLPDCCSSFHIATYYNSSFAETVEEIVASREKCN